MPDARAVALIILGRVFDRRLPLDQALSQDSSMGTLSDRDRSFARNLVSTTLRHRGTIDRILEGKLRRPLGDDKSRIRHILRLGVCQLIYLETPAHAVVNTAVQLVPPRDAARFGPLVNAVLRRVAEDGPAVLGSLDTARLDLPDWLWQSWSAYYGEALCAEMAAASLSPAPTDLTFTLRPGEAGLDDWAARLGGTVLPGAGVRLAGSVDPTGLAGFADGAWWVQDVAATLPARLLGPLAGVRVLDLCAAPGGKAAQLAVGGARVTALDRAPGRMQRLRENFQRLGLSAEMVVADAEIWRPEIPFDAVLLDAPCSATGTLRRHPDIGWVKSAEDVTRLAALQRRLIGAAAAMLRPGGRLVYCTCSLQPEEGEWQADAVSDAAPGLVPDPILADEVIGLPEAVTDAGWLRTLPCFWRARGGMDGFFAARFRRV